MSDIAGVLLQIMAQTCQKEVLTDSVRAMEFYLICTVSESREQDGNQRETSTILW
jgi:hypothetical protein